MLFPSAFSLPAPKGNALPFSHFSPVFFFSSFSLRPSRGFRCLKNYNNNRGEEGGEVLTLNTALRKGSLKVCLDPSLSCLTKKENIVSKVKRTGRAEERSSFSSIQPGRAGGEMVEYFRFF